MTRIKWLWWFLRYVFGFRFHFAYATKPTTKLEDMDIPGMPSNREIIQIVSYLSRGRIFMHHDLIKCRCRVCGAIFWSIPPYPICRRFRCYMEFHLHPKKYPLLIYPSALEARRALKEAQS